VARHAKDTTSEEEAERIVKAELVVFGANALAEKEQRRAP
jgi:hypothetical protein